MLPFKRQGKTNSRPTFNIMAGIFGFALSCTLSTSAAKASEVQFNAHPQLEVNQNIPVYEWNKNHSRARAVVVLIHGLTQRSLSLTKLAEELARNNYIVYAMDLRGHGNWHLPERKHVEGYRCNFKQSTKDLESILSAISEQHPRLPSYIIGESIGAAVALHAAADLPTKVNGVALCAFGAKMDNIRLKWALGDCVRSILHPSGEIPMQRYQLAYACENPQTLAITMNDPYSRESLKARESLRADRFVVQNKKFGRKLNPETSLLLLKGEKDKIVSAKSAEQFLKLAPSLSKSLVVIPASGHMLIGRPDLFPATSSTLNSWIEEDLDSRRLIGASAQIF